MDPLSNVLSDLNVAGRLYFQKTLALPWSVNVHHDESVVRFHIVQSGHCYVRLRASSEPILIEQGDIVLISQGESHTIYSDPSAEPEAIELNQILYPDTVDNDRPSNSDIKPGDTVTQIVCGHYTFNQRSNVPLLSSLPAVIHRKNANDEFSHWMNHTLELCASNDSIPLPHSEVVVVKTAEIALALAIRMYLNSKCIKGLDIEDLCNVKH